ncbi:FitA-like ribbon-helix-helix domain-containing protein [Methylosinus sporium]|uniref:FitA-like ribbon-helix-helix domain-containing protein n=1 Tax=Methylosinus sporium TaxID=428 RepID=UPI0026C52253
MERPTKFTARDPPGNAKLDCTAIIANFANDAMLEAVVASITIRNLDDDLKRRLRMRAAEHGRSMEEEAREILRRAIGGIIAPKNLGHAIHARFAAIGGVDLELPARGLMREPPSFS